MTDSETILNKLIQKEEGGGGDGGKETRSQFHI